MTDPHRARLFDMARAAGYHLVPADDLAAADAMSAAAVHEAMRCRAALITVRSLIGRGLTAHATRLIDETLDPAAAQAVAQHPPPDVVREVIVDHSPPP